MFPWRAFQEDGGPFPVMSSVPNTLEYDMQVGLSSTCWRDPNTDCKAGHHQVHALASGNLSDKRVFNNEAVTEAAR